MAHTPRIHKFSTETLSHDQLPAVGVCNPSSRMPSSSPHHMPSSSLPMELPLVVVPLGHPPRRALLVLLLLLTVALADEPLHRGHDEFGGAWLGAMEPLGGEHEPHGCGL